MGTLICVAVLRSEKLIEYFQINPRDYEEQARLLGLCNLAQIDRRFCHRSNHQKERTGESKDGAGEDL